MVEVEQFKELFPGELPKGCLSNWSFVIRSVVLSFTFRPPRERIRVTPGHCKITAGYEWCVCGICVCTKLNYPSEYQALTGSPIRFQKWIFKW